MSLDAKRHPARGHVLAADALNHGGGGEAFAIAKGILEAVAVGGTISGAVGGAAKELGADSAAGGVAGEVVPVLKFGEGVVSNEFAEDIAVKEEGVFAL